MKKMNRKGFTLVELLTAIVIIALLSGLGVISYQSFFKSAEERYYDVMESNIVLAGNDYFEDHREKLQIGS
jgi:prepilin-type N-terminal cleavage/methylation domain-containing protein